MPNKLIFKNAIVRTPCKAMVNGITEAELGQPNYRLALEQHAAYVSALQQLGINVTQLDASESFPDSCFVEDVAVLCDHFAIISNPGAASRNGEKNLIAESVGNFFAQPYQITGPGTLDGGDVMMVGQHFYIGLSDRTNQAGFDQFKGFAAQHGCTASTVTMIDMLHLKTGLNYLENNQLLTFGEFNNEEQFASFTKTQIADEESYATNSLWINGSVLVPTGFPKTLAAIQALGFPTIELGMSEFQKLDGGLSCLSLRF